MDVPSMLTVDRSIRLQAQSAPAKIALRDGARALTFRELDDRADRVAAALAKMGLKVGSRLAVLMTNRIEWAEILFGCARSGVVCVPINNRFVESEIAYVIEHSGAEAFLSESRLAERIERLRHQLGGIGADRFVMIGEPLSAGWRSYESFVASADPVLPFTGCAWRRVLDVSSTLRTDSAGYRDGGQTPQDGRGLTP